MSKKTPPPAPSRDRAAIEHDLSTLGAERADLMAKLKDVLERMRPVAVEGINAGMTEVDVARVGNVGRQAVRGWLGKHSYALARQHDRGVLRTKATAVKTATRKPRAKTAGNSAPVPVGKTTGRGAGKK